MPTEPTRYNTAEVELIDRFAMAALPGLLATTAHPSASNSDTSGGCDDPSSIAADARELGWGCPIGEGRCSWAEIIADEAYTIARAMIHERREWEHDGVYESNLHTVPCETTR